MSNTEPDGDGYAESAPQEVEVEVSEGAFEAIVEDLREKTKHSRPKGEHHCPNCDEFRPFLQLQVIERPEFGVRNVVQGCPECYYCLIPATEWVEVDGGGSNE